MKFAPVWKAVAVVALVLASLFAFRYLSSIPRERFAALMGVTLKLSDIDAGISGIDAQPSVGPPTEAQPQLQLSTVAIQTFSGASLVRSGPGTVVSSDGLVLALNAVAPYGAGGYAYQVLLADGRILRASRVAYDAPTTLVLLKVDVTALNAVTFVPTVPEAGAGLVAVGAFAQLSKYVPLRLPVTIVYALDEWQVGIAVDRTLLSRAAGAQLVDRSGRTVGILQAHPTAGLVPASAITAFLERYFAAPR